MVVALPEEEIRQAKNEAASGQEGNMASFGYYYLAEKIDGISNKVDNVSETLSAKINNVSESVTLKINNVSETLSVKIDNVRDKLEAKIDARRDFLENKIDGLRQEIKGEVNDLRQEMNGFRLWAVGTFITVIVSAIAFVISK